MPFGKQLKRLRLSANLTQQEFSKAINKSRSSLASYETTDRVPDIETVKDIARYFSVSTDYLLGIDDTSEEDSISNKIKNYDVGKDLRNLSDKLTNNKYLVWQGKPLTDEMRRQLKSALGFLTNMVEAETNKKDK